MRILVSRSVADFVACIAHTTTIYLVGDGLRDSLLGVKPRSFEMLVENFGITEGVITECGYKPVYTNSETTVSHVTLSGGYKVTVSGLRSGGYTLKDRKSIIPVPQAIETELSRRDFTINAMALRVGNVSGPAISGVLIDPHGGMEDLERGIIRFVGDPRSRIEEDPARMLRAVRLSSELGFTIEEWSLRAIKMLSRMLDRVPMERIRDEFMRILLGRGVGEGLNLLVETGLYKHFMPELGDMARTFHDNRGHHYGESVLQHTIDVLSRLDHRGDSILVLATLLHDVGKPATQSAHNGKVRFLGHDVVGAEISGTVLRRLHFPDEVIKEVATLVLHHMRIHTAENKQNKRLLAKIYVALNEDPVMMERLIRLAEADAGGRKYEWSRRTIEKFKSIPKLLDVRDVLHVREKYRLEILRKAREIQLAHGITSRRDVKKILKSIIQPGVLIPVARRAPHYV